MERKEFAVALAILLASLSFAFGVAAQDPMSFAAPEFAVGDRWTWNVKDSTTGIMVQKGCSPGYPSGAQETKTVTLINDIGYVTQIVGPMPDWRYPRTYLNDGSYRARLEGKIEQLLFCNSFLSDSFGVGVQGCMVR